MSMEDVILVATVREEIRGGALRVDAADISRHMANAEAKARLGKLNAETKADEEPKANFEADDNAAEAEAQNAKREVVFKANAGTPTAKFWAEVKANREAETKAKAESKEKREACVKAEAEAEAREKDEAEARENLEVEDKVKAEAFAKFIEEAKVKAAVEAAKVRAKADEKKRVEAQKAEEVIARQRAADKAARAAVATSYSSPMSPAWGPGGSWLSKIASAATAMEEPPSPKSASPWNSDPWSKRHAKHASSPSGRLRDADDPGTPVQRSSTTSSTLREFVPTHPATSIAVVPSSTMVCPLHPFSCGKSVD